MGKTEEIVVPANLLDRNVFAETLPYRNTMNREPLHLLGDEYAPGTLFYLGYAGNWQEEGEGKFRSLRGGHRFRLVQPRDAERDLLDHNELPGLNGDVPVPKPKKRKKAKVFEDAKPIEHTAEEVSDGNGNAHPES